MHFYSCIDPTETEMKTELICKQEGALKITMTMPKECINGNAVECKESRWGREGENNTMISFK
jgi:hypothetical protein